MRGGRAVVHRLWRLLTATSACAALAATAVACTNDVGRSASVGLETDHPSVTSPDGTFQTDPDVRIVTLDNGLTVYLRHNETPGYNAELRLVVNAGSVDETPDQAGVAHFLEHMMFNGTTKRPGNELVDQLREFGMEFGADVNAYTSYDETVYQLSVPAGPGQSSDDSPVIEGLDILAEWLSAATLDPTEIDAEIGVVLDEWRSGQSFDGRLGDAIDTMYLTGSAYEGRSPIGTDQAIQAMTAERLRAFYDTWYRPDNVAVVVVGDIDVDDVETSIRSMFGDLQPRATDAARPDTVLPSYAEPRAVVFTDPDTSIAEVELALPAPAVAATTPQLLRQVVLDGLVFQMLETRLGDDIARGEATFTDAYQSGNSVVRPLDAPSIVVTADADQVDEAFDAVLIEFERADRFGFSANELDRAVATARAGVVASYDSRDSTADYDFVERYVQQYLVGEPAVAALDEYTALIDLYDSITVDDVSTAFSDRYHASGSYVLVMAPDTMAASLPTTDEVLQRLAARTDLVVEPRADSAPVDGELMARPEPIEEVSADQMADDQYSFIDPTLLTFPNGARVVLNPSGIADDSVVLSASSPGGLSLVADADVPEGMRAVEVAAASGLGSLDAVQLDTILSASSVAVTPYMDLTTEGFSGASTTDDVETMLQVIALYLEQPRFDQAALDSTIDGWLPYVDDPKGDPDTAVYATYAELRYGGEPRLAAVPTAAELDSLDLATLDKVWRERFASPGDWVFALSGDFDVDEVTDLVRRYIGTLQGDDRPAEVAVDLQPPPPDGVVSRDIFAGSGDKADLTQIYDAPADPDDLVRERVLADVITGVVSNRLTDRVREELGASYSPYGYSSIYTDPDLLIETIIDVTGAPDNIDELTAVVTDELEALRSTGPTSDEFDDAMAAVEQSYDQFDDDTLAGLLVAAVVDPTLLDDFIGRRDTLADIELGDVRTFLQRALPADHYIELRLLPE